MLATGTRLGLEEEAVTWRLVTCVYTSLTLNEMGPSGTSSSVDASARAEMVGRSFTGLMVTVKGRRRTLLEAPPSLTVTVITTTPLALVAGVKLRVPLVWPGV